MPFISKDWRSPGEEWVRYEGGWELKKTVSVNQKSSEDLTEAAAAEASEGCEQRETDGSQEEKSLSNEDSVMMAAGPSETTASPSVRPKHRKKENDEFKNFRTLEEHLRRHRLNLQQVPVVNLNNNQNNNHNHHQNNNNNNDNNNLNNLNDDNNDDENNFNWNNIGEERKRRYSGTVLLRLDRRTQPFCTITLKNTREVAGFNELAEAMLRLDMIQAVKDIRRFNYVSKLMFLLFNHDKLSQLPGSAQKILFRMLEEMADTVYKTNQNQHVLQNLMEELQTTMTIYHVWGSHLGSAALFKQHVESRRKITEFVEKMQVEFKQDLAAPSLVTSLPEECVREILLRLSDSKDIEMAGRACTTMNTIAREKRVWRELVQTHFSKQQVECILQNRPCLRENHDWRQLYHQLRRRFGLREDYTEVIVLCRKCSALFWQSLGHPCFIPVTGSTEEDDLRGLDPVDALEDGGGSNDCWIPLTPVAFLSFFSV